MRCQRDLNQLELLELFHWDGIAIGWYVILYINASLVHNLRTESNGQYIVLDMPSPGVITLSLDHLNFTGIESVV